MKETEKPFDYVPIMPRSKKPRDKGLTAVRDIKARGMAELTDLCETVGEYLDFYKMACATQRVLPKEIVKKKIDLLHKYEVMVSTGGFLERVLTYGPDITKRFIRDAKEMGFDILEISNGVISISIEDKVRLIKFAREVGMKPLPEVAQAYGLTEATDVQINVDLMLKEIEDSMKAGAWKLLIEEEGLTENVKEKNFDALGKLVSSFDVNQLVFECGERGDFSWYVKKVGPEVNLHIDGEWVAYLEALRTGAWGKASSWGRSVIFPG